MTVGMKITRLKFTRRGDRVNIYLDGEFAFSISQILVADFALFKGKELDTNDIEKIKTKDLMQRYCGKALNLIARRPRSTFEIKEYLKRKLYKEEGSEKFIKALIKKLKEKGYLNDFGFAQWWVENRVRFKPRGKFLIVQELRNKGIKSDIIKRVIESAGLNKSKEYRLALELGEKKRRILGNINDLKKRKKFMDYLLRKGFSYDITIKVLNELYSDY